MRTVLLAVLAAATLGTPGCSGKQPAGPALGEVHSAKLRGHMAELRELVVVDLSDATRSTTVRSDLARIGAELEVTARRLPDLALELGLDEDDRSKFVLFADSLGASAAELAAAAPVASSSILEARIGDVTNACSGCHWAFRGDPPGE